MRVNLRDHCRPRSPDANKRGIACYFLWDFFHSLVLVSDSHKPLSSARGSRSENPQISIFGQIKQTCNYRHSLFLSHRRVLGPIAVITNLLLPGPADDGAPALVIKSTKIFSPGQPHPATEFPYECHCIDIFSLAKCYPSPVPTAPVINCINTINFYWISIDELPQQYHLNQR